MRPATYILVIAAVSAFAGNSLIARTAIGQELIQPGPFSVIRLAAGAFVLLPFLGRRPTAADLPGSIALLTYMATFSFAYAELPTATGALILFASVQCTILCAGYLGGESVGIRGLTGLVIAGAGIAWLFAPNAAAPQAVPSILMVVAGIAWGAYTLIGRKDQDPAGRTARSFLIAALLSGPLCAGASGSPSSAGIGLAVIAGIVTSAAGYVVWYQVAPRLSLGFVAGAQLATPILAALGAALILAEPVTWRLAVAGTVVLGGIALTVSPARRMPEPQRGSNR